MRQDGRRWTEFDEGLLYTLWVVDALVGRRDDQLHLINPPFAVDRARGERIYTHAPFQVQEWAAPGDGSYLRDSSFFFATGRGGLTMTAAAAAFRASGNARRRAQAAQAAVPRWMVVDQGGVWVSSLGFWLQTMQGLIPWPWENVQGMTVVSQGVVQVQGVSAGGPFLWQLTSPAAETLFALWVVYRGVAHPQWMDRSWIPSNWVRWAADQGRRTPFDDADQLPTVLGELS